MRLPDRPSDRVLRIAIYVRASRVFTHRPGISIQQQEQDCVSFAERSGWIVVDIYRDVSKSAYKDDLSKRPAFQQMLHDAKARKFDAVLVYKLDRFARRVLVQYQAAAELERYKVEIVSATEHIERRTAAGKMTFGMLAVAAETYSALHGERMRDTREAEARAGKLTGPIPFGLLRRERKIHHHPDQAPIVLDIFKRKDHGYTLQTIVSQLTMEGKQIDGRNFKVYDIKRMLHNRAYIGIVTCGELEYPASFEPIVPRDLWDRVHARMARTVEGRAVRSHRNAHPLGSLGYCANCGGRLHHQHDRRRDYRYYYCSGRRDGSHCNAGYNHTAVIDHQLAAIVKQLGTTPGDWYEEALDQAQAAQTAAPRPDVDRGQVEDKLRRLARAYGDGAYTEDEYQTKRRQLLALLDKAPEPPPPVDFDALAERLRDIAALIDRANDEEKAALYSQLFAQVYARPTSFYTDGAIVAIRPTRFFATLLVNIARSCTDKQRGWIRMSTGSAIAGAMSRPRTPTPPSWLCARSCRRSTGSRSTACWSRWARISATQPRRDVAPARSRRCARAWE